MSAERAAYILDITRLVGRAGAMPLTGIDRVERAYLQHFCEGSAPFMLVCRTALGWLILDRAAARQALAWIDRPDTLPAPSLIGQALGRARQAPALEAALRGLAVGRMRHGALGRWLVGNVHRGAVWVTVGHTNLGQEVLAQARGAGLRVMVMIHDLIALEYPQWSGPSAPAQFLAGLTGAASHADVILFPSHASMGAFHRYVQSRARLCVAPLGVTIVAADAGQLPAAIANIQAPFLALGTIEPRKNIGFLLNIWDSLADRLPAALMPKLIIAGRRGWEGRDLFARLDGLQGQGVVFECADLPDPAIGALMERATALIAPSRAEGFGLPPAEAARRGLPVIAADLAVTREVLGAYPTYLPSDGIALWVEQVASLHQTPRRMTPLGGFDWTGHFNLVFNDLQ